MKKKSFGFGKFILIVICCLVASAFVFKYAQEKLYFDRFNKLNEEVTELEEETNTFNMFTDKARMFAKTKGLEFAVGSMVLPDNYLQDCKGQIESNCKKIQDSCYIDESKIKQVEKDLKYFKYFYKILNSNKVLRELDEDLISRANRVIVETNDINKKCENLTTECMSIFDKYVDMYQEFVKIKEDAAGYLKAGEDVLDKTMQFIEDQRIQDSLKTVPIDTIKH